MIISFSRRFIFIHTHKTAGESIHKSCRAVLTFEDIALDSEPKTFRRNGVDFRLDKHSTASDALEFLGPTTWKEFFSFSVVREPISRAVSLYNWSAMQVEKAGLSRAEADRFLQTKTPAGYEFLRWPSIHIWSQTTCFSEFIRHPYLESERAWKPQVASLSDGSGERLIVDQLLRFENLSSDWEELAKELELPGLPKINVSKTRPDALRGSEISDEDRHYLEEVFRADFEYLGYAN
jgi:hypothetical protein